MRRLLVYTGPAFIAVLVAVGTTGTALASKVLPPGGGSDIVSSGAGCKRTSPDIDLCISYSGGQIVATESGGGGGTIAIDQRPGGTAGFFRVWNPIESTPGNRLTMIASTLGTFQAAYLFGGLPFPDQATSPSITLTAPSVKASPHPQPAQPGRCDSGEQTRFVPCTL